MRSKISQGHKHHWWNEYWFMYKGSH
jgi:hypothetical protein